MYRALLERKGRLILFLFIALSAGAAAFLPRFGVEAGTDVLLNEDDPDLGFYNTYRARWEYDDYAIFCVRRADWFTPESVAFLKALEKKLEEAPQVERVVSILSVPLLRNQFLPVTLASPAADLGRARKELLDHRLARAGLISQDGRDLSFLVYLRIPDAIRTLEPQWARAQGEHDEARLRGLEKPYGAATEELRARRTEMIAAVRRIAAEAGRDLEEPVRLSGLPIITINLVEHVEADLVVFGVTSFALFVLAFLTVYRKVRWTALPILTCLLPVVLILGTMAAMDRKVTVITSNLPVLLFVLMLPYTVYFVERYRERRSLFPGESALDTTVGAAREIWTPCLYSALTTMAGFASLLTSGIHPVRTFGLMMTVGMGVGLTCVFLFLPSAVGPLRALEVPSAGPLAGTGGAVRLLERMVLSAPGTLVGVGVLLLAVSGWGCWRIKVETKFIDYFRSGSEVYRGLEYIDTRMGGTTPLEVELTSKQPGFFKTPEGLEAIAAASSYFDPARMPVGSVQSLKELVDEVRKWRPMTVDQILKIKAAATLVRGFANEDFTTTRILVRFRETDPALHRNNILRGLERHLRTVGVEARDTGVFRLYANMLETLIRSQRETFFIVVGAIYVMLLLLFRSFLLALVVLIPQVLPTLACLGAMGFTGVPLDLVTVMIASISMGVGIDAAIQYTVRFRIELKATGGDWRAAVSRSHATIGRAIWIATSIVMAGFAVLALSKFVPSIYFGLFTALAMLMGQLAALTLLPPLFLFMRVPRLS